VTGILGGAFDPPHLGHLSLAERASAHFELERLLVQVIENPGHKAVPTPAAARLELARIAFADLPGSEVALDPHPRTVDSLEALALGDPVFLIGADELADFLTWKQPDRVLELARLGVATRPGTRRSELDPVLAALAHPERVELFALDPVPIASSEIRVRVAAGLPIDDLVPAGVAAAIERLGLYRERVDGAG
jgi:nicotinate-nucleotide adenylyltransferase